MKLNEIFHSPEFYAQRFSQDYRNFVGELYRSLKKPLDNFEEEFRQKHRIYIGDVLTITSENVKIKDVSDSGFVKVCLLIDGSLGPKPMNMADLFDGDDDRDLKEKSGADMPPVLELIHKTVREVLDYYAHEYGLAYVSPASNFIEEKIRVDKFDIPAHIVVIIPNDVEFDGDAGQLIYPPPVDREIQIMTEFTLYFPWPPKEKVNEAISPNVFFEKIQRVASSLINVGDYEYIEDAIGEADFSNLDTGFFLLFDMEHNFQMMDLSQLYDGPRVHQRELKAKANKLNQKTLIDINEFTNGCQMFGEILHTWKEELGLQSFTFWTSNGIRCTYIGDQIGVDAAADLIQALNPNTGTLKTKMSLRFPAQK